jgi:hypothetical protein
VQYDKTRIVIRERTYLELLDLSLRVVREFAGPLALVFALGVGPMLVFNAWLLAGVADPPREDPVPFAYVFWTLALTLLEAPIAMAPMTLYLGAAVFSERPRATRLLRDFLGSLPQLIWFRVLFGWLYTLMCQFYMSHVILLERTPATADDLRTRTTFRRSMDLHRNEWGELFGRAIFSIVLGTILAVSLWLSIYVLRDLLLGDGQWSNAMFTLYFPAVVWLVVGLFSVARFLGYIDLRIRSEGWEVELLMRAEGARLTRQWK